MKGINNMIVRQLLPNRRPPHVCVIGAGVSGLRCAEILIERGIKVTIIEGRNRIGGRVHQSNHLGHLVDLGSGPNWIHGTDHNPFVDFAKETGTIAFSIGERSAIFNELGHSLSEEKAIEYSELVWGIISDAFKYSNENTASIPPNRSLMDYFKTKVEEKDLSRKQKSTILNMAQMWGAFVGDPIERQSLKFFWLEECIEGENLFVASTYQNILKVVAKTALAKAFIRYSTKVISIHSTTTADQNTVTVKTENDESLTFDEVVLTAPLGWLKRNKSAFTPPLPPQLTRAIENISYGRLEKVYVTFPTAFWDNPPPATASSTPCPPASTPELPYPIFTHFLSPTPTPQNPHPSSIELVSLSSLPSPTNHPTLLFYIHGPTATHLTTLLNPHPPTSPTYLQIVTSFLKPYYSLLPNFTPACTPTAVLATNWQNDNLAGHGSYCNFQVSNDETVRLDADIEVLREGCPDRGLWLAGEHTAPFVALGTVTGAYWSGEAVGGRVAACYGLGAEEEAVGAGVKGKMEGGGGVDGRSLNGMAL
ncbi:hypothetical protein MMC12_007596 [Toensbergia leucococca]|nr:hypothetical protein [Toensbergia leucococca]